MVTSSLTVSNPTLKKKNSDRLFFDRYQYCLTFFMPELSCLRGIHKNNINLIELIANVRQSLELRYSYNSIWLRHGLNSAADKKQFSGQHRSNLENLAELLFDNLKDLKIIFYGSWGYVYSNELKILKTLSKLEYIHSASLKEIIVNRPKNTIALKSSLYKFRTYFFEQLINQDQRESIVTFLQSQQDIRLSPALSKWCQNPKAFYWLQRSFFIDHNEENFPFALQLIHPHIIRKTMPIIELNN